MTARKQPLILMGIILTTLVASVGVFTAPLWWPGITPTQTARIIVEDDKFGMRAVAMGKYWGDGLLEPLRSVSEDYSRLSSRNSLWIADVLAANASADSLATSEDLFGREPALARLVGAVGLAASGRLPPESLEGGGLIRQTIGLHRYPDDGTHVELALIAAGHAQNTAIVEPINEILAQVPMTYWVHVQACRALARLGDSRAIPALISALENPEFYAEGPAFYALLKLGERRAIPLAIARLGPGPEDPHYPSLLRDLKEVTGEDFAFDAVSWQRWWEEAEASWHIPQEFSGRSQEFTGPPPPR